MYDHVERYDARLLTRMACSTLLTQLPRYLPTVRLLDMFLLRIEWCSFYQSFFVCCRCSSFEPRFADCSFCCSFCRSFAVPSFNLAVRHNRNRLFMFILSESALASALKSMDKPFSSCRSLRLEPYRVSVLYTLVVLLSCVHVASGSQHEPMSCSFKEDIGSASREPCSPPAKKEPQSYHVQSCVCHVL